MTFVDQRVPFEGYYMHDVLDAHSKKDWKVYEGSSSE